MSTPGSSVADPGQYPGTVLEPNTPLDQFASRTDGLEQFGTELPRPDAAPAAAPVAVDANGVPTDPTLRGRWEHHQSRAQKAEDKLKEVEAALQERVKYDPLVDLIRKDDESLKFLQARLAGSSAPGKPLEAPQKPDSYSEAEAYSNPDSKSFQYRKSLETYRDAQMQDLYRQNSELVRARQEDMNARAREAQALEQKRKFRDEVVSQGIPAEQFEDFLGLVNGATKEDMVEFYKFRQQSRAASGDQGSADFRAFASGAGAGRPAPRQGGPVDLGKVFLEESRRM